ncbi:NAD(P)/FAD-dependent oxidoreductase [Tessaracoccus sp. ZS01]|uniref:dihydrolipoyl dehydrogenase family protein n=1 Tax=Tessaracoccus sp. ZS01 TaxID=1906324 RepID=UPI00096CA4A9|nr:NAD(P)/FAD-dependent oxidoreductase [Tessaracoccus sp. ZS01]MCG6567110.1 NAD(P)/FAD-dependent oxidoreductase [Tessaracoccus sp. ZS01]OMG57514.1 pyridine nucleotide-disulfide oxidoreductase [Tessaracoccus sp. ZS01]
METTDFDLIVIGAGSTGENVADRAVAGGLSVAVVESDLVGGDCSYWACMPSKALIRPGEALRAVRAVAGASTAVTGSLDVGAVLERRDSFTSHWDDTGQVEWVQGIGATLVRGAGRLTGEREVTVDTDEGRRVLRARHAVAVCTGTEPLVPDIPGLRDARPWTSKDATSAERVPESLVVIGGGVVACELASAFADLGADVSLIARSGLLGSMEPFAGEAVEGRLRERGVQVLTDARVSSVTRSGGEVTVATGHHGRIVAAEVLVATGRRPRTGDLGLEAVGLEPGEYLAVDDTMRVGGHGWLYAVGDVNGRVLLTHQGKYQARAAGDVIAARAAGHPVDDDDWGRHVATADHRAVPQVVFSDPQVASVGLTAAEARDAGIRVRAVEYALGDVAGASLHADGYDGRACLVIDEDRSTVVGATFVGADVAELLHAATIAVVGEVPLRRLWHAVPAYPTISEVWLRLLEAAGADFRNPPAHP